MLMGVTDIPTQKLIKDLDLLHRIQGQRKRPGEKDLINIVCAFDIETSRYNAGTEREPLTHSFMYHWQFQLGPDYTITGRTWEEYTVLLSILTDISIGIAKKNKSKNRPYFVTYVHNLAFEFMYLQGVYKFENDDCFFRDTWKPIYARHMCIEYRCSYLQSNMKLEKFAEQMGCKTQKLDGRLFDYDKLRWPWTPLTEYEQQYCINDVISLEEAIRLRLQREGDTLRTIPLTSTGYPRRDCKNAIKSIRYSIECMLPDHDTYNLLRRCFRGGNTHANRFYVNQIVNGSGGHLDITSSYPTQQLTKRFPMGPFRRMPEADNTLTKVCEMLKVGNAIIADYTFKGLRLKDDREAFPYLTRAQGHCYNEYCDNGRIMSADLVTVALTEIDLGIVLEQYHFDSVSIANAMTAIKAPLPPDYREVILKYFEGKTRLKGVAGMEYEYTKLKNLLNSIYGMSAQQAIHALIYYSDGDCKLCEPDDDSAETELKRAAFPYQWGVYTTAYARLQLHEGLKAIPKDPVTGITNALYIDTDSIFYKGTADFTKINTELEKQAKRNKATSKDKNGKTQYMGVWTAEEDWKEFISHGAKRYAWTDNDDKLHVTVSGVSQADHNYYDVDGNEIKEKRIKYCVEELAAADPARRPIDNFREGMVWSAAGGTMAIYRMADECYFTIKDPETDRELMITPNQSIVPTTYTLTYTEDYRNVVNDMAVFVNWLKMNKREK